jgi:hypothetical protein
VAGRAARPGGVCRPRAARRVLARQSDTNDYRLH